MIRKGELEDFKEVNQMAIDWEKANRIRIFLTALEEKAKDITDLEEKERINQWIKDNRKIADWLDPLIQTYDEVLGNSISVFSLIQDKHHKNSIEENDNGYY